MKRIILAIGLMMTAIAGSAHGMESDSTRYLESTLGQNWFITVNGGVNWWQGSDRNPAGNYTVLNGPTFGGGVSVGKWITHNLALRLTYDINREHSFINGHYPNLPNFQFLFKENPEPDENGYYKTTFMYHNLHGEVLLSPIDLILGYYDNRFYTPLVVLGMGVACASEHVFVTQTFIEDGFYRNRNFEPSANIGLVSDFRITNNIDLALTTMVTATRFSIDSWGTGEYGVGADNPRPRFVDFNYNIGLGLNWNLSGNNKTGSRIYELPINYSKEMREMLNRINHLEEELDECMKRPKDTIIQYTGTGNGNVQTGNMQGDTVKEFVSFPFSIFFHIDSYQLMSKRDLVNLREIANVAIQKGWKIRLRGSCDSATATAEYNQRLSENRCNKIKLELMDMGVPEDQFILIPVGGVKELDPTEYDRRVLIELVKEIK